MQRTAHSQPIDDSIQCVPRHVKRALAYMRSNMAEKITLPALASACAAPERTLLKQFQKSVGVSPLAYLRRLRLNLARRELLRADCKREIADIAISCGFTHLGRFATEYRRAFGESPSATRQRPRARVADRALMGNKAYGFHSLDTVAGREKPSLLILPLRTETLRERLEA